VKCVPRTMIIGRSVAGSHSAFRNPTRSFIRNTFPATTCCEMATEAAGYKPIARLSAAYYYSLK